MPLTTWQTAICARVTRSTQCTRLRWRQVRSLTARLPRMRCLTMVSCSLSWVVVVSTRLSMCWDDMWSSILARSVRRMLTQCSWRHITTRRTMLRPMRQSRDWQTPTMRRSTHCRRWHTSTAWSRTRRVISTLQRLRSKSLWERAQMQSTALWLRSGWAR